MAVLGFRFCARAFSVAASGGHSSSLCAGLSLSRPLLLRSTGSRCAGSVAVAHGPSCSMACGIFPDQVLNPCPLHWQADSQPLRRQGSPKMSFLYMCVWRERERERKREREELLQNVNNWWTYIKDIWLFTALFCRLEIFKIKNWENIYVCIFFGLVSFLFLYFTLISFFFLFSFPAAGFLHFSGNSAYTNWPPVKELFRELHNIQKRAAE